MKKHILIAAICSLVIMTTAITSCEKPSATITPITDASGSYTGTLLDSDVVAHQDTTRTAYPVTVSKLTETRIHISSSRGPLEAFDADITTTPAGFSFSIPAQSVGSTDIVGVNVARYNFPAGSTGQYISATHRLSFAIRVDYSATESYITAYSGTK